MEHNVKELVERAQRGERAAFDELVCLEKTRLEAFVRARVGGNLARKTHIEDILQETLLRAYRDIREFRPRGDDSFAKWICGIASHVILEAASGHRRSRTVPLDFDVPASETTPSHAARKEERFDRLQDAIDSLSPEHREVILLVRVEGLPVKEVARRMDRTPHAVSNLLLRASQRLKEILGETESLSLPDRRIQREGGARDA